MQYVPPISLSSNENFARFFNGYDLEGGLDVGEYRGVLWQGAQRSPYVAKPHIVFDRDEMLRYITFREFLWERQDEEII